jgi:hypothetical protein
MKKKLLVTDPAQQLPSAFLEGLGHAFDVVPYRPGNDPREVLELGPWHGAVIASDGETQAALAIARYVKKTNPASIVILLDPMTSDASCREALEAGIDVIVGPGAISDLYAAIMTRISSSVALD